MSKDKEREAGTFGSAMARDFGAAVASGRPLVRFFDDVSADTADAVARMMRAAATVAATAPPAGTDAGEGDPLMFAFAELGVQCLASPLECYILN